jgi:hypothetical protein
VVDYGYEPFPADGYDPFGADSYDPFPVRPLEPEPVAESVAAPNTQANPEAAAPAKQGVIELAPWPEFSKISGETPEAYAKYVNDLFPKYLAELGYTPKEIEFEVNDFKKAVPSPLYALPERSFGELASDGAQKLGSGVVGFVDKALEFSKITDAAIPTPILAIRDSIFPTLRKDAKDFLAEQKANINAEESPKQQVLDKNLELKKQEGIAPMLKYAITNPSILAGTIIESLPEMAATMGGAGKAGAFALESALAAGATREVAEATAKKVATYASMVAEGGLGAAGVSSDVNTAMDKAGITDPIERAKWNLVALPAGVITAAAGRFSPFEISLFTSKLASQGVPKSLWGKFIDVAGASGKNGFEEYGQSGNEKVWTNVGSKQVSPTDIKAWLGVGTEAAYGALTGVAQAGPTRAGGMLLDTIRGRSDAPTPDAPTPDAPTPDAPTPDAPTPDAPAKPDLTFEELTASLDEAIPPEQRTLTIESLIQKFDEPTTDKQATFEELTAELKTEGIATDPGIESFLTQMRETIEPKPVPQSRPVTPAAPTPVDFGTLTDDLRGAVPEYAKSPLIDTLINELDDPLSPNKEGTFAALTREIGAQRQNSAPDPFMDTILDGIRSKIEAATAVTPDALQLNQGVSNENVTQDVRKDGYENGQKNEGQGGLQEGQEDGRQGDGRQGDVQNEGQVQEDVLIPKQPEGIQQVYPRIKTDAGNLPLQFANDVDRALYVVGRTQRRDATASDLSTWLQEKVYPGSGRKFVQARAAAVVQAAKTQAATLVRGDTKVVVPAQFKTGPGDAAIREARVAGNEPELSQDQNEALAQLFPDDQLPEGTSAVSAATQIAGAQDAIQKSPNASQIAAYIAADSEPVRPRFGNQTNQAGTRQSNAASSAQVDSTGGQKVQPRLSRRGVRSGKGDSASTRDGTRTVAEGRASVLDADPVVMRPYEAKALEKFALELSLLAGKVNEAEDLANYFQSRVDEGYGSPTVDPKKLERARQIQRDANQVAKMRRGPITPEALALITDPVTGEIYDSPKVRRALEASKLPESTTEKIKEGDVRAALKDLSYNGSTPLVRGFALRLSEVYLGGATIKIQPIDKAKGVAGRFKVVEKLILLDPDTGLNERVFLHEAAHAATVHALANPVTKEQQKAVGELTDLYNRAKQSVDPEEYGMRNIAEFIAEAFANPDFQYQLYKTSAPDTPSFWQRFVSAVVKLLGMDNLLGRTANVAEALFMAPNAEPSLTQAQYDALAKGPEPATINIDRDSNSMIYLFDRELSIENLGKQLEKAVGDTGNTLESGLNLKELNGLKRSNIQAWLKGWEKSYWKPIQTDTKRMLGKFGIRLKVLEGYLSDLDAVGRAKVKMDELDPEISNHKELMKALTDGYNKADATLKGLQQNQPAVFKELIGLAKKINAATGATLQSQIDAGNSGMNKERMQRLQGAFKSPYMPEGFYVPQQIPRADGNEVGVLKTATGRTLKGENPLSIIYAQAALTAQSNFSNAQKQVAYKLAKKYNLIDTTTKKPLFEIGPTVELKRDKATGIISEGQDNLLFDRNAINVWIGGELKRISVINPALREMLQRTPEKERAALTVGTIAVLRWITQVMAVTRTGLRAPFVIKNTARDAGITVPVNLDPRVSLGAYTAALPGAMVESLKSTFGEAFGQDSTGRFAEASKAGAFISQRSYIGLTDTVRDVTLDLEPTLLGRIKSGLASPMDTKLGQIALASAQAMENGTRLAVYDAAISSLMPANPTAEQRAATVQTAAYIAKTTTINFERKGKFSETFGPAFMFINPKMQGTKQLFDRSVGADKNARTQAMLTGMVILGVLAGAVGYANDEKDENGISKYKKIASYKRDSNIIFGAGQVGMPLTQEVGLFYILGNSLSDIIFGGSDVGEGTVRFMKALLQQAAPFATAQTDPIAASTNGAEYIARLFTPALGTPIIDFAVNRNTFGGTVVPDSMRFKNKPDYQKFTRGESSTSIEIAKKLYENDIADVSPATLTYMAKFLEGGTISSITNMFADGDKNTLAKNFIMTEDKFYDSNQLKDAQQKLNAVAERAKVGTLAERAKYFNENRKEIELATKMNKFLDFKSRTIFKGYSKMTDAQVAAANERTKKPQAELLADWYKLKGSK